MADKSAVGKEYSKFTWEVERGKIRELVQAIGETNPIYVDKKAAIEEGYEDVVASPTFITVPTLWAEMHAEARRDLKLNFAKILHGEEMYEYYQEIYPGDTLMGKVKIVGVETKYGETGDIDLVTIEKVFMNQRNETVLKATTVIVERK